MIGFLEGYFGEYPFRDAGGIVDDLPELQFALENQTRPIYAKSFFYGQPLADLVVIHELAHQWYGNSLTVADWRHVWLNEGFASYMEWLWSEEEGLDTAQQFFDKRAAIPADDPFWSVTIGDPGADKLFDGAVYERGAMTVHALRQAVGDDDFFTILGDWPQENEGGNVTLEEFMAFAEEVSGEDLTALFNMWLFTSEKPSALGEGTAPSSPSAPMNIQRYDPSMSQ
jgi:aminopeptidase N